MTRVVAALGSAAVLLASPAVQEPALFRGSASLVSIYATVVDPEHRLVTNLTEDDFEVYDDGKLQPIALFSNELQPISVVMMLDRSGSMENHFDLIRDGAMEFVKKMRPDDRARIGSFANDIRLGPADFTGDRAALTDVLRHDLQPVGASPVWTSIDRSVAALQTRQGRRVVLIFTDGHDDATPSRATTLLKDVRQRIRLNEVMIYAIGFAVEAWQQVSTGGWSSPMPGAIPSAGSRSGVAFAKRPKPPDPALKELAEESGGGYFEMNPQDDLGATFARVAEELHRQYWIGFRPAQLDGKTHEITVRVKRAGVRVRARKSYEAKSGVAPQGPAQPRPGHLRYN